MLLKFALFKGNNFTYLQKCCKMILINFKGIKIQEDNYYET